MKPNNKGKEVETLFQTTLETAFKKAVFIERFTDTADATAKANGRGRRTGRKKTVVIVEAQPADFMVTLNGVTAYTEVKDCNNKTSFPFGNITTSQMNAAKRQVAAKGLYFFVIHHQGQWHCVPAKVILETTTRKSLPWKDLQPYQLKKLVDIKRYFK